MGRSRQARLARLAKQAVQTTHTSEELLVAEEVLLADEIIPIEEVISVPVEPPTPVEVMVETPVPVATPPQVQQGQRSPQNVLDSIIAMLFQQHYQQIYQHMLDLESQIIAEQKALAEKNKVDNPPSIE